MSRDDKDMVVNHMFSGKSYLTNGRPNLHLQGPRNNVKKIEELTQKSCELKWQVSGSVTVGFVLLRPSQLILFQTRG